MQRLRAARIEEGGAVRGVLGPEAAREGRRLLVVRVRVRVGVRVRVMVRTFAMVRVKDRVS